MILIACVDDNLGMAFNHRRQSKDQALRGHILALTAGRPLWMSPYSAKQFGEEGENIRVDEAFLSKASEQEFAFTEIDKPGLFAQQIEQVVLYHWNRLYPADLRFDLELSGYTLTASTDFAGSSHEKITEEIYTK